MSNNKYLTVKVRAAGRITPVISKGCDTFEEANDFAELIMRTVGQGWQRQYLETAKDSTGWSDDVGATVVIEPDDSYYKN